MDIYPACLDAAQAQLPGARRFGDFDSLVASGCVDAVFLACDPLVQVPLACQAMRAGLHVCTEVPVAFTIDECWDLVRTVEATGQVYLPLEQTRHWGFIQCWTDMHARGEFGHITFAQGEYIHYERNWNSWTDTETGEQFTAFDAPDGRTLKPTWRYQLLSNPIYYLPHTLSPLLKVLDDRVVSVSCLGTQRPSYTYREEGVQLPWSDLQYALMQTEKDTILTVGAGFSMPAVSRGATSSHWYDVRGTEASVESPRCRDDAFRVWRRGEETFSVLDAGTSLLDATEADKSAGHGGADARPVNNFLHAIRTGEPLEFDVYRAVETAAPAVLAAESANRNGERLLLPDFRGG